MKYVEKPPHVHPTRMRHISDAALHETLGPEPSRGRLFRTTRPVWDVVPGHVAAADALCDRTVDFLDPGHGRSQLYGFHYLGWMGPLVSAYAQTKDARYARAWERLFLQWYGDRDNVVGEWPGLDVVWYSLGVCSRSALTIKALAAFAAEPALSDECWNRMLATVLGGARWAAEEHDSFRHGNWQLACCAELLHVAGVIPEFTETAEWAAVAKARLIEHLEMDVYPDGGHFERSPGYHSMCLNALQRAAAVGERYLDWPVISEHPRFRAMHEWLATLADPAGWVPALQDSGIVWPAEMLSRGPDLRTPESRLLDTSKYAVFRADHFVTVINYGPYVGHELEPHSHHAALDFVISGWGVPLAWEAGGPPSYDDPGYYDWFQAPVGHNIPVVDGEKFREDRNARLLEFRTSSDVDTFAGEHDGYSTTHRRRIEFVKTPEKHWVIRDHLPDKATWLLHGTSPWRRHGAGFASERGPGLYVLPLGAVEGGEIRTGPARIPDPGTGTAEFGEIHTLGLTSRSRDLTVILVPFEKEPPENWEHRG
jgi:hypothetical protein